MIVKPTTIELLKKSKNQFELVTIVSKRARQIVNGDNPLIESKELSPITIASLELDDNKYKVVHNKEN